MKTVIKAKNFELTPALEGFIEEKFGGLKKFIDTEVVVEVKRETRHHRKGDIFVAGSQISLPGKNIVAEATSEDLFKAIIESRNELKLEIGKHKVKKIEKNRRIQKKLKKEIAK